MRLSNKKWHWSRPRVKNKLHSTVHICIFRAGNVFGLLFVLGIVGALTYLATMSYLKGKTNPFRLQNLTDLTNQTLRNVFSGG